jgi:DNA invertase Pin-like site-specific DNA recombinase
MGKRATKVGLPGVAVAYLRVSTEDQKLGPEAQRAAIESWATREGVTIKAWHLDQGVSGGAELDQRPALAAALASLGEHRAGQLVVAKRDRLARDVVIAATIERAAGRVGARVVAADGVGNGEGAAEGFMRTVIDGAAQYERALIRARTKAALAAKRAQGERTGTVPFGYRLAADRVRLEPDPAEQAVIQRVRDLRAAGVTLREIVEVLRMAGARSRRGKPLGLAQVHALASLSA